jgi:hypothetical protein
VGRWSEEEERWKCRSDRGVPQRQRGAAATEGCRSDRGVPRAKEHRCLSHNWPPLCLFASLHSETLQNNTRRHCLCMCMCLYYLGRGTGCQTNSEPEPEQDIKRLQHVPPYDRERERESARVLAQTYQVSTRCLSHMAPSQTAYVKA